MPVDDEGRPRSLVPRADAGRVRQPARPSRWTRRTCSTSSTPRARPESRRGSCTPPAAIWSAPTPTTKLVFDLQRGRRLLVHRRHRLGDRPQLRRLRTAGQRRDGRDVRRRAGLAAEGSLLVDHRAATASRSSTPRRRRSARSCGGAPSGPQQHDLSSLRLLGSVGEPINPEAWIWYHKLIGGERCPDRRHVVADRDRRDHDHAAARRHDDSSPVRRRVPFPGIAAEIRTEQRRRRSRSGGGLLALTRPWPSMLRGIYGDPDRYVRQYWNKWGTASTSPATAPSATPTATSGCSAASTTCINVAGHRIGTMEVESALVDHPAWPKRRWSAARTRSRDRRSPRSSR